MVCKADINSSVDINTIVKPNFTETTNFVPLYFDYKYVFFLNYFSVSGKYRVV